MRKVYNVGAFAALFALATAAHADLPDFTQLVEKNGPSVVNITATQGDGIAQQGSDAESCRSSPRCTPHTSASVNRGRANSER